MDLDQPTWLLGCPKKGHFKGKYFFSLAILMMSECFKILCQNNSFDYILILKFSQSNLR